MTDPETLSKQQLLDLIQEQMAKLAERDTQLSERDTQLSGQSKELAKAKTSSSSSNSRSTRKIGPIYNSGKNASRPRASDTSPIRIKLKIDFGDTAESADAADGLHDATEEAGLIPAHRRRRPRKKSHAFPSHFPRIEEVIDVDESTKTCSQHGPKQLLPESMWDVRPKLVMVPPTWRCSFVNTKSTLVLASPSAASLR